MATGDDQWLKEDGYLNVDAESVRIVYHPFLNVILVFTREGEVKVLDVNSGVILQSYRVSDDLPAQCRYLPDQDKILFWNGRNVSMRGDYNGVLLLDTILQAPITQADDNIRIELLLSEAVLFLQCLQNLEQHGLENTADVTNELTLKIGEAQQHAKRGIKAQKWETICLELSHSSLRMVAGGMVMQLKRLDRHIPALAIASAINERLTDLLEGARVTEPSALNRFYMFSEATRRQTFEGWPHMDYKWVLPDQMAQAGFYHYPGDNGNDDRAMCFTCNVCLVCWEKTDEPWSEHERHSPECPFVKGEFTQNVPLSVTYATSPAVSTGGFSIISAGDRGNVFCTGNSQADVTVWNVERQLTKVYDFKVKLHPDILTTTTISCNAVVNEIELTALSAYYVKHAGMISKPKVASLSLKPKMLGTKIVCGIRVNSTEPETDQEESETTLLLVVYNVEETIGCDESKQMSNSSSTSVIPPAKKSSLSTIDEKYEDDFIKFLSGSSESQLLDSIDKLIHLDSLKMDEATLSQQLGDKVDTLRKVIKASSSHEQIPSTVSLSDFKGPTNVAHLPPLSGTSSSSSSGSSSTQLVSVKSSQPDSMTSIGSSMNTNVTTALSTATSVMSTHCDVNCIPLQYIEIPSMYAKSHESYHIGEVIPSSDNKYLLVVLRLKQKEERKEQTQQEQQQVDESEENETVKEEVVEKEEPEDEEEEIPEEIEEEDDEWRTILYLYYLNEEGLVKTDDPLVKWLTDEETPTEIVMLPKCDSSGRSFGGPDTENGIFVMTCEDGKLRIVSLKTLNIVSEASVKDDRFVSATYCKSLERLCGCTLKGCLHFYSFYDLDADSSDERDDDVTCMIGSGSKVTSGADRSQYGTIAGTSSGGPNLLKYEATPSTSTSTTAQLPPSIPGSAGLGENHLADILLAYKSELSIPTLKVLYSLTLFNEMLTPYSAEVPGCWSELEQAQKQRRHPQHLRPGDDTHLTKTWRLHNDATTWDEHLIELNLPKCTSLGHIDFKFSLYQPCTNPPAIQVTLLKQKSIGLCSRRKTQSINRVDESINFNIGSSDGKNLIENPVLSEEYLQARNAEILVGPIELAACMDLSEQAGSVTLTSPKLLKSKGRNYLLHIKTMTDLSKDGQAKTRVPVRKKGITSILLTSFVNISQQNHNNNNNTATANGTTNDIVIRGPRTTSISTSDEGIGMDYNEDLPRKRRASQPIYKCTWKGCGVIYTSCSEVTAHVRNAHLGPRKPDEDSDEEDFFFTEIEDESDSGHSAPHPPSPPTLSHRDMARPPHEDPEYQRQIVGTYRQGLLSMSSQQLQQQQTLQQHPHLQHYSQQIQQQQLSAAIKPPLPGHQAQAQLHHHHQQQQQQQQQQSLNNNNNSNSSNNNAISQSGSNSNGSSGGGGGGGSSNGGSSGAVHPHSNTSPLIHHNYTWSQVSPTSPQKHVRLSPRPSYPYPSPNYSNQIAQQHHYQQQQQLGQIQLSPGGTNYHQQSALGGIGGGSTAGQVQSLNGAGPFVTPGTSPGSAASSNRSPLSPNRRTRGENKKCRKVYGMDHKEQWCTQCKWKKACSRFGD